jgi:hypothetical protein
MQFEAAGINAGEEVLTEPWNYDRQRSQTRSEEGQEKNPAMLEAVLQQVAITFTHAFECGFESTLYSNKHIAVRCRSFVRSVVPKKVLGHSRNDGSRQEIRRQHGENNRLGER